MNSSPTAPISAATNNASSTRCTARSARPGGRGQTGDYLRRHAADHAAAAGQLPLLLKDPHYLAVADFPRLLALLAETSAELGSNPEAVVVRQVGFEPQPFHLLAGYGCWR